MRTSYVRARTPDEAWGCLIRLRTRTVVVDVEPLVAFWDTDRAALDEGITTLLAAAAGVGPEAVVFSTNSAPTPSAPPGSGSVRVDYLASAGKPLRVGAYRDLRPRPGAVVGGRVATDGTLAWRPGYAFVHDTPGLARRSVPPAPDAPHRTTAPAAAVPRRGDAPLCRSRQAFGAIVTGDEDPGSHGRAYG